jgi:hypothetical protein
MTESKKITNDFGVLTTGLIYLYFALCLYAALDKLGVPFNKMFVSDKEQTTNITNNNTASTSESANDKLRNKTNAAISNRTFTNDENGLYTVIKFEPANEGAPLGALMLSQMQCDFSFSYTIQGNEIDAKFLQSGCGRTSQDVKLYYNAAYDNITTNIGGQTYVFK